MRRLIVVALPALLTIPGSCAGVSARPTIPVGAAQPTGEASAPPTDSVLRAELVQMGAEDQVGRDRLGAAVAQGDTATTLGFMRADSARTRRLKQIVAVHGWPTRAMVGKDGVRAAWLIVQHSPDHAWQEELLPTLEKSGAAGEVPLEAVALLTDRVLVHAGKPQRYGNSFSIKGGRLVPDPIEDLQGLDARRAAIGLPPMAEYTRMLGEIYRMPVDWPPR